MGVPITVVVDVVALLNRAGVGAGILIVTVVAGYCAIAVHVCDLGRRIDPIAVIIDPVAEFRSAREDVRGAIIAVSLAGAPSVLILIEAFIDEGVAIVVEEVARFLLARVDGRVVVVAIDVGRVTVVVRVWRVGRIVWRDSRRVVVVG